MIAGASEFFSLSFTVSFAAYTFIYLVLIFLASSAQIWSWLTNFPPCFPPSSGSYPRSIDRWTVRVRARSYSLWLDFSWLCGDRLFCVQFTFCRGHTRLCGVQCVCLVYRLRSVVGSLDCVVYHVFVWCTVYVLSWSHMTVKCTICLLGVPFAFCRGHTWRCSVPCVCVVYRLRSVVVTLDGVVYNMFVWCTVYVMSWSHLTV